MKKVGFVCMLTVMVGLMACEKDVLTGGGAVESRAFAVDQFSSVETHYDINASITYGNSRELVITGYENLLDALEVTVENGVLKLKYDKNYMRVKNSNIRAAIQLPVLLKAGIYGSGSIGIHGYNTAGPLGLGIYGSGDIRVLNSVYDTVVLDIHGSGNIEAQGLQVKRGRVNVYGSGHSYLTVLEKLDAGIYGSGNIYYWGGAPVVNVAQNGSGRVIRR